MMQAHIARLTDWTYVIICFAGVLLFGAAIPMVPGWLGDLTWPPQQNEWIVWALPPGIVIMGWLCVWVMVGAVWRLRDEKPVFVADAEGIRFHPSFHSRPLKWRDVKRIEAENNDFQRLRLTFRARFWSPNWPLSSTEIVIPLTLTSLGRSDLEGVIKCLQRWHAEAEG